jgi:predicted Ser/Thr protein kinase
VLHRLCPSCDVEIREVVTTCPTCSSKLVEIRDEIDDLVGTVIDGRFEMRAKLGQGGMGTVYRAWQRSVGREVAVKLIERSFSRDPMAVRRFLREARLASQLSQPNTVSVFDFGQIDDGRLFIAMELIRGRTLHQVVQADGAFSIERVARIGVQICDALEAAHALGIVHRDLKLENVIVLDHPPGRDLLKVLDFGLAKNIREPGSRATESGIVVGTPRYMSPEATTTGVTSPAGDVYSLGVILGELATGTPLWVGDSLPELVAQKIDPQLALSRAPATLRGILGRLLDPEPDRRPTAEQTRALLAAAASGEPNAGDTITDADADAGATTNLRSPSGPAPTRQLTPERLAGPVRPASEPATPPSASLAELDRPPVRRWPLAAVAAGAVAAVVITVVLATRGGDARAPSQHVNVPTMSFDAGPLATEVVDTAPTDVPFDASVAAPSVVEVSIVSEPAGASFSFRGKTYKTPAAVAVAPGTELDLQLRLAGRQPQRVRFVADQDQVKVVKLVKLAARKDEGVPF